MIEALCLIDKIIFYVFFFYSLIFFRNLHISVESIKRTIKFVAREKCPGYSQAAGPNNTI